MLLDFCDSRDYQVRAACGRRIGMCGYTSVPEDGRTCMSVLFHISHIAAVAAVAKCLQCSFNWPSLLVMLELLDVALGPPKAIKGTGFVQTRCNSCRPNNSVLSTNGNSEPRCQTEKITSGTGPHSLFNSRVTAEGRDPTPFVRALWIGYRLRNLVCQSILLCNLPPLPIRTSLYLPSFFFLFFSPTVSVKVLCCRAVLFVVVHSFFRSSGQILLPRNLMNALNNFDKTAREYSLAPTDDLIRLTAGRGQIV